jgi:hypothetical protein
MAGTWRRTLRLEHGAVMQRFGYLTAHAAGA